MAGKAAESPAEIINSERIGGTPLETGPAFNANDYQNQSKFGFGFKIITCRSNVTGAAWTWP
jgi:hypothetical protein